jgi:hypothetical protein
MQINTEKLIADIYSHYVSKESELPKRQHLGASVLGDKCERSVFFEFRWYDTSSFPGRILRLFNTGKREEERVVENLTNLGFGIDTVVGKVKKKQIECRDSSGHMGGSIDGLIHTIPPEYGAIGLSKPWILEIKTHSDKNFKKLQKDGMKSAYRKHYLQMQVYMGMLDSPCGLYVSVNKNTDELHIEAVPFDKYDYSFIEGRAERILSSNTIPDKISVNPSWFECKLCKFHAICHENKAPSVNCRTCKHSNPSPSGKWSCNLHFVELSAAMQEKGCQQYSVNI